MNINLKIIKMKFYLIPICFFALTSCNLREINYSDDEIKLMKQNIVNHKDTISYADYHLYLGNNSDFDSIYQNELLAYSLKIKEVYPNAYYDIFSNFLRINNDGNFNPNDILKLAKPEQDLLVYYLEEGAKKEQYYCIDVLAKFYEEGIYFDKNLKKSDSLTNIIIYPKEVSRP